MRRLAIALVGLVLLSACKIRVELDTVVEEDGSGTVAIAFAFDKEFRDAIETFAAMGEEMGGEGSGDLYEQMLSDVPEGWTGEKYADGEFEGVKISRAFDSVDDLAQALSETESFGSDLGGGLDDFGGDLDSDSDSSGGSDFGEGFALTRDGDVFSFELDASEAGLDEGLDTSGLEGSPFGGGDAPLEAEIVIRLRLPGKVLEHNADRKDGNTLVWSLEPGDTKTLSARSDASQSAGGGSSFPIVPVVLAGILVVAAAAVLIARNRQTAPAAAGAPVDAGAPPPPPGGSDVPPPPPPPPPSE